MLEIVLILKYTKKIQRVGSMKFNLNGKKFVSVNNTSNGEVGEGTLFSYYQEGDLIWADYKGGKILQGHLSGRIEEDKINFLYHHVNTEGELMAGKCISEICEVESGRLKLIEKWQWFTGDQSCGESEIVEVM